MQKSQIAVGPRYQSQHERLPPYKFLIFGVIEM